MITAGVTGHVGGGLISWTEVAGYEESAPGGHRPVLPAVCVGLVSGPPLLPVKGPREITL